MANKNKAEQIRPRLTPAQWIGLNHLAGLELMHKRGGWYHTCPKLTAATARVLEELRLIDYEAKILTRGPDAGKISKRVRYRALGRLVTELGPTEDAEMPAGEYVWDLFR